MKKNIVTFSLIIFCFLQQGYAQRGIHKKGEVFPEKFTDTLKVEFIDDMIFTKVEILGVNYRFFIDTGASTFISSKVKGNFKIIDKQETTDTYNRTEKLDYVTIPDIKIGNLNYKNITVGKHDMEYMNVDGILGANIMAKGVWDFDMKNKQIIISNEYDEKLYSNPIKSKMKLANTGSPLVTIKYFEKIKEKNAYLDFGFNGLVSMSPKTYKKLKKRDLIKQEIYGSGKIGYSAFGENYASTRVINLDIQVGEFRFDNFLADVDWDEESTIGCVILNYYRVILDFKNKDIYYIPTTKKKPSIEFKTHGISYHKTKTNLEVSFVWQNASNKGIKVNDKILSINDIDLSNMAEITEEKMNTIDKLFIGDKPIIIEINSKENFITLEKDILIN